MIFWKKLYNCASSNLIRFQREIVCRLGFYNTFFTSAKGQRVIIYHGISEKEPLKFNSLFITRRMFEKQLRFYKKYFNVISLDDYYHKRFDPARFNICISFDDGFANNFEYALPLLEKYQLPATFFITSIRNEEMDVLWNDVLSISSVNSPKEFSFDGDVFIKQKNRDYISSRTKRTLANTLRERGFAEKKSLMECLGTDYRSEPQEYWMQMTTEEIKTVAQSTLITIGSHGYYHNDLAKLTVQALQQELKQSKLFLESIIQKPVTQIAFPYGSYSADTILESINAGYEQLFATEFVASVNIDHSKMRERMGVNPYISLHNQMYAIVKGKYA